MNELNTKVGTHDEVDAFGNKKTDVPGLGVKKEQLTFKKDNVTGIATVGVEYSRTFQLKPFKKWKTIHFQVYKSKPFH
jgi:hypothetical protein